jgi:hypothetical protein
LAIRMPSILYLATAVSKILLPPYSKVGRATPGASSCRGPARTSITSPGPAGSPWGAVAVRQMSQPDKHRTAPARMSRMMSAVRISAPGWQDYLGERQAPKGVICQAKCAALSPSGHFRGGHPQPNSRFRLMPPGCFACSLRHREREETKGFYDKAEGQRDRENEQ